MDATAKVKEVTAIDDALKEKLLKEFLKIIGDDGPTFTSVDEVLKTAKFADLIEIKRNRYFHWTVYIENGYVINFDNPDFNKLNIFNVFDDFKGLIGKRNLTELVGNDLCRINNKANEVNKRGLKVLPIETIKENVVSLLEVGVEPYNLIKNNCEHFATRMRFGIGFSNQIELLQKMAHETVTLLKELLVRIFGDETKLPNN